MPPTAPSNIRVFVHWREPTVYAGEEIACVITFRNVASTHEDAAVTPIVNGNGQSRRASLAPTAASSRRASIVQAKSRPSRTPSAANSRGGPATRGHRPALSLNVVSASSRAGLHTAPLPARTPNSAVAPRGGHGRSLSIMSLGSDPRSEGRTPSGSAPATRPARGHGRSASLQIMPKPTPQANVGLGIASLRQPSPLYESTTPPALAEPPPMKPIRKRPGTVSAGNTPQLTTRPELNVSSPPDDFTPAFQFPPKPAGRKSTSPQQDRPKPRRSPSTMHSGQYRATSPRPHAGWTGALSNLDPVSRVMSDSSIGGTPRSSSDFYSKSNHSNETLTSELPSQYEQNGRLLANPAHSRQPSRSAHNSHEKLAGPETLMMGYAQTMGNFTLDGSLVNAAPFEEVKRKGVQGGGGVVGLEKSKRSSGMFGALSWGNIGESLSGLLGTDDMSSMAQMKANAGSKAIPLLSTPQSLLFVDLRLAPGESRSYDYRFVLPRGLPPSHRGRSIKVNYHLAIGIQQPGGQAVKRIQIPFRVLGSYNARGETLGHDLMSPYILLHDAARTKKLEGPSGLFSPIEYFLKSQAPHDPKPVKQGLEDFLRYTERLLEQPQDGSAALLSPTSPISLSPTLSRQQSLTEVPPANIKEAIDFAILRSNQVNSSPHQNKGDASSANRFNIARSGQPVAILTIVRPAYRLGEAVVGTIDFTALPTSVGASPSACTYGALIELESVEKVDPSLAIRSNSSINRVTRRVHASQHENTLFSRQISFSLPIPGSATPTFETTGVSLVWTLRVHFMTSRQKQISDREGTEDEGDRGDEELLEELGSDERGTVLIAKERLMVESFEVAVPLKIFGAPGIEVPAPLMGDDTNGYGLEA